MCTVRVFISFQAELESVRSFSNDTLHLQMDDLRTRLQVERDRVETLEIDMEEKEIRSCELKKTLSKTLRSWSANENTLAMTKVRVVCPHPHTPPLPTTHLKVQENTRNCALFFECFHALGTIAYYSTTTEFVRTCLMT